MNRTELENQLKDLLEKQAQMEARIRELEQERKATPAESGISAEKRFYLRLLARATARGDREKLRRHNAFVRKFYKENGPDAVWPVPNIF